MRTCADPLLGARPRQSELTTVISPSRGNKVLPKELLAIISHVSSWGRADQSKTGLSWNTTNQIAIVPKDLPQRIFVYFSWRSNNNDKRPPSSSHPITHHHLLQSYWKQTFPRRGPISSSKPLPVYESNLKRVYTTFNRPRRTTESVRHQRRVWLEA